jgi:hypothetical protein
MRERGRLHFLLCGVVIVEIRFRCVVGMPYDAQRMHAAYVQFVKTTRDQFNNESCEVVTDATPYWVGDYFDDETGEYLGADGEGVEPVFVVSVV